MTYPIFTDTSRGRPFAKDPAVVFFGGRFLMYYSIPPYLDDREKEGWSIGIAESPDLDHWAKISEIAAEAGYEDKGFCAPGAIVLDGTVHLFYQTYGNCAQDAICHAYSFNGVNFIRNRDNPIFSPVGSWNNGRAIDADVVEYAGALYLFSATRDPAGGVQILCAAKADIHSGFGRNAWTQICDQSILRPALPWEQDCIEAPAVLIRDGLFHMFYAGAYNNSPQQVGHAISEDGVHWRRTSDKPFLSAGEAGAWNSSESGHPYVFEHDGRTHLFFQGNDSNGQSWSLARIEVFWDGIRPRLTRV